ncbi:alpha-E domain-containing protein [Inhella gelatinilytica]|uniref:Alpha-E domain-containing protein n=1 Tax=Inhella gelatinilytica TaxID=2795030 RepID=A0A931NC56_9BURK|nr:alpha-E domain-containing protein [Inhella gelatinilytica]MBH9554328.1 alpha-E domain-containing protein [Inhella gelatinilytica]
MLSRTASQLYWMSRYMERAENLVRMLDVTQSLSLMPQSRGAATELAAPLAVTGALQAYQAKHTKFDAKRLFEFMALDLDNPASVVSCLRASRENAHAVRGQITAEMWEAVNATWLEAKGLPKRLSGSPSAFFDWVKERSHQMRGATVGTLQRNDAYCFIRLGTFIERADNTARLLDVKSQLIEPAEDSLQPVAARQDSSAEFYAWSALLRSLSAFEAYHAVYRDSLDARRVAELLILRGDVPRSLRSCAAQVAAVLPEIQCQAGSLDAGRTPKLLAGQMALKLQHADIDAILDTGLHAWITHFLDESAQLSSAISRAYFEAH